MNISHIVESLKEAYDPKRTNLTLHNKRSDFLSECIIPTNILVYSGNGATLTTNKGKLIDLASMTVNCILGQNDPWVNANLVAYLLSDRPSFLTTRLGSEFYYKVAKRICDVTKMADPVINHRQNNGTDVTELAVLIAHKHRKEGQHILASFNNSYHGQGLTAYLMSGLQRKHKFLIGEDPVRFFEQPTHVDNVDADTSLSTSDASTLNELYASRDKIFAVIIEPIQINNSLNTPSKFFMHRLKETCEKAGIALIYDEVQTGFGWLGKMTAAERLGAWPNLLALSKAVTAGYGPLSVLVSDRKYKDIDSGSGEKTNGADIRSLVASNAVMDRLLGIPVNQIPQVVDGHLREELEKGLLSYFSTKQSRLLERLADLQEASQGLVGRIKGDGLIRGIEILDKKGMFDPETTEKIQLDLLYSGVLVRHNKHTLLFKVPIVIKESELDRGFSIVKKVLKKYITNTQ